MNGKSKTLGNEVDPGMATRTLKSVKTRSGILLHPQDFVYVQMEGAKRPEMAHVLQIYSSKKQRSGKGTSDTVKVHWLYRPLQDVHDEDLDCAPFPATHVAELFYSFHEDILSLDAVLQTIVVYCIPRHQEFEKEGMRRVPGFFCKRVYSKEQGRHALHWLTDKDYNSKSQRVVNGLLEKTRQLQNEGRLHTLSGGKHPKGEGAHSVQDLSDKGDGGENVGGAGAQPTAIDDTQTCKGDPMQPSLPNKTEAEEPYSDGRDRTSSAPSTSAMEVKRLQRKVASWLEKIAKEPTRENLDEAMIALPRWASKLHDRLQDDDAPFFLSSVWKIAGMVREIEEREVKLIVASSMIPTILGEWAFALVDAMDQPNGYKAFVLCCEAVLRLPVKLLPNENAKISQLQKRLEEWVRGGKDSVVVELATKLLQKSFR